MRNGSNILNVELKLTIRNIGAFPNGQLPIVTIVSINMDKSKEKITGRRYTKIEVK